MGHIGRMDMEPWDACSVPLLFSVQLSYSHTRHTSSAKGTVKERILKILSRQIQ